MRENIKISILAIGEMHSDPIPIQWISRTIEQLKSSNFLVAFCAEEPSVQISEAINNYKQNIQMAEELIAKYNLKRFHTYDLPLGLINFKNQLLLTKELKNNRELKKYYNSDQITIILDVILNNEANKQKLIFLQKIQKLNILYIGMDNVIGEEGATQIEEMLQHSTEQKRINDMVSNIFNLAISPIKEKGGIIICLTGMMHSHRLAANLLYSLQQNKSNIEFKILPINLHSEYVQDKAPAILKMVSDDKDRDISAIKTLYKHIDCQNILIPQATLKNPDTLDKIINDLIVNVAAKKTEFIIPNMNTEKELSIIKAGGSVVEYIPANNSAKISIASSVLENNVRVYLGIDRYSIKFSSETALDRLEYLRKFTSATIEESVNGKYLITFPQEQLEIIKGVVYNWESVRVLSNVDNNTKCL